MKEHLKKKNSFKKLVKSGWIAIFLVAGLVLTSGCISNAPSSEVKALGGSSGQDPASKIGSDSTPPDLLIKQSDVPGLTLGQHNYFGVKKSEPFDEIPKDMVEINTQLSTYPYFNGATPYEGALYLGYRNVGEYSNWADKSGKNVVAREIKLDSKNNITKYFLDYKPYARKKTLERIRCENVRIGEQGRFCEILGSPDIGLAYLEFIKLNSIVTIYVVAEKTDVRSEAMRIANKVNDRLS